MLNIDTYLSFLRKFLGIDKSTMLDRKIYLSGKFRFSEISQNELRSMLQSISAEAANCKQTVKENYRGGRLIKQLFSTNKDASLDYLGQIYDKFFENIIISQWFTIKFVRDRLQEFPVLESLERFRLPARPVYRLCILLLFPVFLGHVILYAISVHKIIKRLGIIQEKSLYLFEAIEHPSVLVDFES